MTRRGGGPRALAPTIASLTRPVFRRRGFAALAIVDQWPDVVGAMLASRTMPERIAFPPGKREDGTLHLRVDSGSVALELQHLEALVIERVNGFFGYRAVARLRLVQRPLPSRPERPKETLAEEPDSTVDPAIEEPRLGAIDDPDLRLALSRLGRAVRRRHEN